MRKQTKVLLLVSASLIFQSVVAAGDTAAVMVTGTPEVSIQGQARLKPGDPLSVGEQILVPAKATAQLRFSDGAMVMLAPASDLRVTSYSYALNGAKSAELFLADGQTRVITGAIAKAAPGQFSVRTQYGLFSAYGTDFTVIVCGSSCAAQNNVAEGAYLEVADGTVSAEGKLGSAIFRAGQSAMISLSGTVIILGGLPAGLQINVPAPLTTPVRGSASGTLVIPVPRIDPGLPASPAS